MSQTDYEFQVLEEHEKRKKHIREQQLQCLRCGKICSTFVDVCDRCANEAKQAGCSWEDLPFDSKLGGEHETKRVTRRRS